MKKLGKRLLAMFLCVVTMFSLMPFPALAADEESVEQVIEEVSEEAPAVEEQKEEVAEPADETEEPAEEPEHAEDEEQGPAHRTYIFYEQDDKTEIVRMEAVSGVKFDVPQEPKIAVEEKIVYVEAPAKETEESTEVEETAEGEESAEVQETEDGNQYLRFKGWFYKTELKDGTVEETKFEFPLEFTETSDLMLYARYDDQPVKYVVKSAEEIKELEEQEGKENPIKADAELVEGRITARAGDHLVTVSGMLPMGASLKLVAASEEEVAAALSASGLASAEAIFAYDISIVNAEGTEWQPEELPVNVAITGLEATEEDNTAVIHVDDEGEVETKDVTVENGVTSFEAEGFSLYIIAKYTVDFYYGENEFHLNGGESILLSELFAQLGIEADATTAEVVELIDENDSGKDPYSLVKIEHMENGDWLLTSQGAFSEWFKLHIELANGNIYDIDVTDATEVYYEIYEENEKSTKQKKRSYEKYEQPRYLDQDSYVYQTFRLYYRTRISTKYSWGSWIREGVVVYDRHEYFCQLWDKGVHCTGDDAAAARKLPMTMTIPGDTKTYTAGWWAEGSTYYLNFGGSSYWFDYGTDANINEDGQTSIQCISHAASADNLRITAHVLDDIPQNDESKLICTVTKRVGICDEPSTNQVQIYLNDELIDTCDATSFCSRNKRQTGECAGNNNDTINVSCQPGYYVDRIVAPSNGANVTEKDKQQRNEPFKVYIASAPHTITVTYRFFDSENKEKRRESQCWSATSANDPTGLPGISEQLKNQVGDFKKHTIQPRDTGLIRTCSVDEDTLNATSVTLHDYPGRILELHCGLSDAALVNRDGNDKNAKVSIGFNGDLYDLIGATVASGDATATREGVTHDFIFKIGTADSVIYIDYLMKNAHDPAYFDCYDASKSMLASGNPFTKLTIYGWEETDFHKEGIYQMVSGGQIVDKYKTITVGGRQYRFVKAGIGLNLNALDRVHYVSASQEWFYTYEMPIYKFNFKTWKIEVFDTLTFGPYAVPYDSGRINFVYEPVDTPLQYFTVEFHGNPDHLPAPGSVKVYPLNLKGDHYEIEIDALSAAMMTAAYPNHTFKGWNTARDGSGTAFSNGGTVSIPGTVAMGSTYHIYAQWDIFDPSGPFTARFWKNDGVGTETPWKTQSMLAAGSILNSPSTSPTRDGYRFAGWYLDVNCTVPASFPYTVSDDMDFFASWTLKPEVPSVTDYSGTYDGTAHKASVVGTKTLEYSTDGTNWYVSAPSRTDVGTTNASVRYAGEPDTAVDYTITITARSASFTGAGGTVTYNGKEHSYTTITPANLVSGHTYSGLSYSVKGINAGTYAGAFTGTPVIKDAKGNDVTSNYNVTKTPGALIIKPYGDEEGQKVTVTIIGNVDNNKSYTGAEQTVTGYTFSSDNALYTESLMQYLGTDADKTAKGTDASATPYKMALTKDLFKNNSGNFSNVVFVVNNGQMTIKKAELTATTGSAEKIYDGTVLTKKDGASVTGFVNGEGTDVTITATGAQVDAGSSKNTYTINWGTVKLGTDNLPVNYSVKDSAGTLTVKKVPASYGVKMIVTGNTLSSAYTGKEQSANGFTYTVGTSSEPNKYTSIYTDKCFSFSGTNTVKRTDAGTTYMKLAASQFRNLSGNYESVTFEIKSDGYVAIAPAPLTIVTGSASKTYDGKPLTKDEIKISGIQDGETYNTTGVTNGSQTVPGSSDNTFDSSKIWIGTAKSANYSITPENTTLGTLTVKTYDNEVVIHVKGASSEKYYDGKEESVADFEFVSAGVDFFDKDNISYNGTPSAKGKDVGTYAMGLSADKFVYSGTYFTNVKFVLDSDGVLTIKPAPVTVTTGSSSREYNGKPLTNSEITVSGIVEGETYTAETNSTITTPGSVNNTYTLKWGTAKSTNYTITDKLGTLTVSKVMGDVFVTITGNNSTVTYDAEKHTISGWTMASSNDAFLKDYITFSGNAYAEGTDATTYPMNLDVIQFSNNKSDLFNSVVFIIVDGFVKINPAELTIKAASKTKTFDGKPLTPAGTATGWIKSELAPVNFLGEITNAGTSAITYKIGWDDELATAKESNYTVKSELGTLTINKVKRENLKNAITVSLTGNSDSKTFNASEQSVTGFTSAFTKAINTKGEEIPTDDVVIALADGKSAIAKGTAVGTYYMGLNGEFFTITSTNYEAECFTKSVTDGKLEITKASSDELDKFATVYPYSGAYDAAPHGQAAACTAYGTTTITYSIDGGTTWTSEYPTVTNVADSCNVIAKFENPNYETLQKEYSLTVSRKAATVSAVANGKVYGETDPELTASVTGTLGSDKLSYTVTRADGEDVGKYTITLSGEAVQGNYNVTYKTAVFTITTSKKLTILNLSTLGYKAPYDGKTHGIAATVNKTEGTTISYKYSTDNGESWTEWGTAYPTIKNVGKTLVKVKAENKNYYTVEGDYTLEVTCAQVTVTAQPVTATYGEKLPTPKAEVIGNVDGSAIVYTVKYSPENPTEAGKYDIIASGEKFQGNYEITYVPSLATKEGGGLVINPKAITVKITGNNGIYEYNGTEQTVTGFTTNAPKDSDIVVTLKEGKKAEAKRKYVGNTYMGLTADMFKAASSNYDVTLVMGADGYIQITKNTDDEHKVIITADSDTWVYDGQLHDNDHLSFTYSTTLFDSDYVEAKVDDVSIKNVGKEEIQILSYQIKNGEGVVVTGNYTVETVPGKLEVTKRPVTLTSGTASKEYDSKQLIAYNVDVSGDGYVAGESFNYNFTGKQTLKGSSKNTFTAAENGTALLSNYDITYVYGDLTVTYDKGDVKPEKNAADATYKLGDVVEFQLKVHNITDKPLENVVLMEQEDAYFIVGGEHVNTYTIAKLEADQTMTVKAYHEISSKDILNGSYTNSFEVPDKSQEKGEKTVTVDNLDTTLVVEKKAEATAEKVRPGDKITYTVIVTNKGNVSYTNVRVDDDLVNIHENIATLAVGASERFVETYTVTEADMLKDQVVNVATAEAETIKDPKSGEDDTPKGKDEIKNDTNNKYQLTIHYVYEGGAKAADDYQGDVKYNTNYNVSSPFVKGFTPSLDPVCGTMPAKDVELTVTYYKDPSQTKRITYTVEYYQNNIRNDADSYSKTATVWVNDPDTIAVTIDSSARKYAGMTLNRTLPATIPSEVKDGDIIKLFYVTNTFHLVINYTYAKTGEVAAPAANQWLLSGQSYNVASPAIDGYTPSRASVSGTMPGSALTVAVSYTINRHNVIITIVDENGDPITDTITKEFEYGSDYEVNLPKVKGFIFDEKVSGTMPDHDVAVTVVAKTGTRLVIHYVYLDGSEAAPDYVAALDEGDAYIVDSPFVVDAEPDVASVSGTMPAGGFETTVTYYRITDLEDENVPLSRGLGGWSLVNLILTILTDIGSLLLITFAFRKNKEDEPEKKNQKGWRFGSLVPAVGAIVALLLTQNFHNPMVLVDKWTILMVGIAAVQGLIAIFSRRKNKDKEQA